MAINIPIWPGSSSFFPGDTPYGFYDYDADFQYEAEAVANWCAKRLGYPIVDVELQDINFYTCLEEAVTEYANQVNTFNIRDNLVNLQGASTASNLTQKNVRPNFGGIISITQEYGAEVGVGGSYSVYTGSIVTAQGKQTYDLTDTGSVSFEAGTPGITGIEIRRMFHEQPPAIVRYFDPFIGTGLGSQQMMEQFGWGNLSPSISFVMMPAYQDVLRLQAIEFNDYIRRSSYSFDIVNNKLRLFPIPTFPMTVHFQYIIKNERSNPLRDSDGISDYSNIPYNNMDYCKINDTGRQWIRKYTLALAKEMLGWVRSKYGTIPFPNAEITTNGAELLSAAQAEKDALILEIKEILDGLSRQSQLERKQAEATALQQQITMIPLRIYVG